MPKTNEATHKIHMKTCKQACPRKTKTNLKADKKLMKILELIKAFGFKHAILIEDIIHEKVDKCDLERDQS